tara:strand:+ start:746 stop:982 length:237 start_codon:yes stop_codon:yes gene_type:complete
MRDDHNPKHLPVSKSVLCENCDVITPIDRVNEELLVDLGLYICFVCADLWCNEMDATKTVNDNSPKISDMGDYRGRKN